MELYPNDFRPCLGLAANQVNVCFNIIGCFINEEIIIMINPKIISHSSMFAYLTGGEECLSVDGNYEGFAKRYLKIIVEYYDKDGKKHNITLDRLDGIVVQHEIDHLNGILYFDRINSKDPWQEIANAIAIE